MAVARTKLSHHGQEEIVDIDVSGSGDYTGGVIRIVKNGIKAHIQILETITFASSNSVLSAAGLIPERFWPSRDQNEVSDQQNDHFARMGVRTDGAFNLRFFNYSGGSFSKTSQTLGQIEYQTAS